MVPSLNAEFAFSLELIILDIMTSLLMNSKMTNIDTAYVCLSKKRNVIKVYLQ